MSSSHATYREQSAPEALLRFRHLLGGLTPMILLYALYSLVRFLVKDRGPVDGIRNANEVLHLEERWGINWEGTIQTFTLPHEWIVVAANWYYVVGFLPVVLLSAAIAAAFDYQNFIWWRRRFALTLLVALVGFAMYPLAPPRMLPGMVDTLMVYGPRYYGDTSGSSLFNLYGRIPSMVNVYAAMPSMHVAWSVIAGALLIGVFKREWWIWIIGLLHPILMAIAVIVTANHYLLDVVLGLAALAVTLALLSLGNRMRSRWEHEYASIGRAG